MPFLTRLIWRESSFRVGVVSPAGAQGIAQFMPGTARERGLLDPFDPEQAIPHAAHLLADLKAQFGNLGLAAAAYNGGAARVTKWLAGDGGLPGRDPRLRGRHHGRPGRGLADRTRQGDRVSRGGRTREARRGRTRSRRRRRPACRSPRACASRPAATASPSGSNEGPAAPWGIQLAGNFSKALALQSFNRARSTYAGVIGEVRPMIIGTRLRNRGTRAFYRIRIPAQNRQAADDLCGRIRRVGGACFVLRT